MRTGEYLKELQRMLEEEGYELIPRRLNSYDSLHTPNLKTYPVGIFFKSDGFVNVVSKRVSLAYAQGYTDSVRDFLKSYYTFPERFVYARIGTTVIVSDAGISDGAKFYAQSYVPRDVWRNVFSPLILVDLEQEDVTTPRRQGFIIRHHISTSVKFFKERLSLKGRLKII